MRALHNGLLMMVAVALLVGGVVVAQHQGQQMPEQDLQAHIDQIAEHLNMTSLQRAALSTTVERAHELMNEFHHLHAQLMAELDPEQQTAINHMMHQMLGGAMEAGHSCGDHCPHADLHHKTFRHGGFSRHHGELHQEEPQAN